jgi:hypothetical protein
VDIANANCLHIHDVDRDFRRVQDHVLGQILDFTEGVVFSKVRPDRAERRLVHDHLHPHVHQIMDVDAILLAPQDLIPFHASPFLSFLQEGNAGL